MLMVCCEWWVLEVLIIYAGLLGVTSLAAEVVIVNIINFIFIIPLGINLATSGLVCKYLSEG